LRSKLHIVNKSEKRLVMDGVSYCDRDE
jgi:hypothetical protein